jgi:hypothetical protein
MPEPEAHSQADGACQPHAGASRQSMHLAFGAQAVASPRSGHRPTTPI